MLALAALPSLCPAQAAAADPGHVIDALLQPWNRADSPGCVIGVQHAGAPALLRSVGIANLEDGVPNGESTVFEAGSVSKQFTAAAILLLAQRHALALSDDVRRYLPQLPPYASQITIAELLGHTSGLRDWGAIEAMAGWPRTSRIYTLEDVLAISARQRGLNFPPGTAYSYTNTGFNLLALIVARVSGQSLAEFTRHELFVPLGLNHTQWRDDFTRVVRGRAIAYRKDLGGYRQEMPFEDTYGHGGLLTTVGDLLRWNEVLDRGELGPFVTEEIQRQTRLADGRPIPYARGLFVEDYRGEPEISHSGATASYRAWLGRYPAHQLSIAMLCNASDVNTVTLARAIAAQFLEGARPADAAGSAAARLSDAQLAARAGLYVSLDSGQSLQLTAGRGALRLPDDHALTAVSADEFADGSTTYRFDAAQRLAVHGADGTETAYVRMPPWHPDERQLASFAGRYHSEEALATYTVWVRDAQLLMSPADRSGLVIALRPLVADTFVADGVGLVHVERAHGQLPQALVMSSPGVHGLRFGELTVRPGQRR